MKKITCPSCQTSDNLKIVQLEDDWFIDEKGFMKRKNKIKRLIDCNNCFHQFEEIFKKSVFSKDGKECLTTEIDLNEWTLEIAINPSTKKQWSGKTNGKSWAIVRVYKDNSPMYFGSMFGTLAEELINEGNLFNLLQEGILIAQVGFNKIKRIENGKEKWEWKQTLLFNDFQQDL